MLFRDAIDDATLGLNSVMQEVESGQLQIFSSGSKMRVPGQDWVEGFPLLHLKYFLQFVSSGRSSPSWLQLEHRLSEIK